MTENDFEKFKQGLGGVYDFYDKELSKFALDVWWNAMKQFDLPAIIQAFNRHVINTESGKWLPKPADVIKMLQGSSLDAALTAWAKVDKAVRIKGTYVDVVFDDPLIHRVIHDMGGWIAFGMKKEDEWPFVAKEFENRYRGFKQKNDIPDYPSILTGLSNAYNASKGFKTEPCVLVGDADICRKVMSCGTENPMIGFTDSRSFKQKIEDISDQKRLQKAG